MFASGTVSAFQPYHSFYGSNSPSTIPYKVNVAKNLIVQKTLKHSNQQYSQDQILPLIDSELGSLIKQNKKFRDGSELIKIQQRVAVKLDNLNHSNAFFKHRSQQRQMSSEAFFPKQCYDNKNYMVSNKEELDRLKSKSTTRNELTEKPNSRVISKNNLTFNGGESSESLQVQSEKREYWRDLPLYNPGGPFFTEKINSRTSRVKEMDQMRIILQEQRVQKTQIDSMPKLKMLQEKIGQQSLSKIGQLQDLKKHLELKNTLKNKRRELSNEYKTAVDYKQSIKKLEKQQKGYVEVEGGLMNQFFKDEDLRMEGRAKVLKALKKQQAIDDIYIQTVKRDQQAQPHKLQPRLDIKISRKQVEGMLAKMDAMGSATPGPGDNKERNSSSNRVFEMSVSIQVHPLVVLNISDHLTRAKYMTEKGQPVRVVGALLGKQEGRVLEIVNTVELAFKFSPEQDGGIRIDDQFCQQRLEAYKKLFADLDCIGWYSSSSGDFPSNADMIVHKRFQKQTENPLMIILNPESHDAKLKKILPLFLYELISQPATKFIRLDYSLATSDSERISVDHVAKALDPNAKTSSVSQNMISSLNALKLLRRKIKFLIDVVKNSEEIRKNHQFMRKLNQICSQLPITQREDFDKNAFIEYSDIAAVNLMASVTKGFEQLTELLEDFKIYLGKDFGFSDMQDGGMFGFDHHRMDEESIGMMSSFGGSSKGMFKRFF